mmetsp:Transcript_46651/g.143855  ORF Transcript_46651/g.143855 Transcript_46651/m.143855 type:complete len:277 (-) Transcript_46651:7-837(-)
MEHGLPQGRTQYWHKPINAVYAVGWSLNAPLKDPWCVLSAAPAGFAARAAVLPIVGYDKTLPYNVSPLAVCARRSAYFSALSLAYFPIHRVAQWDKGDEPSDRFFRTLMCGAAAGVFSRLLTNPITKILVAARKHHMTFADAARYIARSEFGAASFWLNEHPFSANAAYIAAFFVTLEASRRACEVVGLYPGDDWIVTRAVQHGVLAGGSAAFASTLTYSWSHKMYEGTVIRDSAVLRGRAALLRKEVPMMATFFFVFSLLQPFTSPAHERCGLGA